MSLQPFHMSFSEGQTMYITVLPKSECSTYSINIGHDPENFALHFNPRFYSDETVCNTMTSGSWDEELHVKHLPFKNSAENKFAVLFTKPSFRIQLPDGQHIEFPNRSGEGEYNHFEIKGDAKVTYFEIK